MLVNINNEDFQVNANEFNQIKHEVFFNLKLIDKLGLFERIVSLINDLAELNINKCVFYETNHGGYIPIKCSSMYKNITILNCNREHKTNALHNLDKYNIKNIEWMDTNPNSNCIVYSENHINIDKQFINTHNPILLTTLDRSIIQNYENYYNLSNTDLYLYIPKKYDQRFIELFHYFIHENNTEYVNGVKLCNLLKYDNLINLCVMVKNGGELFEQMLISNLDIIDRWTILDTGSTDNTIDIINRVLVGKKKGKLYREPFINFRESRNRCLDLAGTQCKFNMMLDDTYCINDATNFLNFANIIRNDQFGDSFSIFIKSNDTEYYSNRITKSAKKLRYIFIMHEIINDKDQMNIGIPIYACHINDLNNDYMSNRSYERKQYDLKCLFEMIEEDPDNPRHLFYIAQSYRNFNNYEKAAEYYYQRAFHKIDGFDQEKFDALIEFTRISIYSLNKPFNDYKHYYELCTKWQPTRPEGDYFLGIGYYTAGDKATAFHYFKKAFIIGFPYSQQQSLKPTVSFKFIPYYLAELCYLYNDYALGLENTILYLEKNIPTDEYYNQMCDWYEIYKLLVNTSTQSTVPIVLDKPIICFVVDGGYTKWSGKNILSTGVGGSETWAIELSKNIKRICNNYDVYVFCNCEENDTFEGVKYVNISEYQLFIYNIKIQHCIISRYSKYIPLSINSHIENIHFILHDIQPIGNIIPVHSKIKNVFCLTEWHKQTFLQQFPQFINITHVSHYGIDFDKFLDKENTVKKIPYSFIYSSFPNRGLITVLKMWTKIQERYPTATLNIFTDINNEWANTNYPDEMKGIKEILDKYKLKYSNTVINHGWVGKDVLANYWKQSHVWFYPCKFAETFCLTALEAAVTKTLVITNNLAGLQDTVGDRGVIIPGNSMTDIWQIIAFHKICQYLDNPNLSYPLIQKNYEWALMHSWKDRTTLFLNNYITQPQNAANEMEINIKRPELNYEDMYNWTNDIPLNTNAKQTFEQILGRFKDKESCNILEIGTYAGTSIIGMLQYLPNATATTIDMWTNYIETNDNIILQKLNNIQELNVEQTFYENIEKSGFTDKITALKGDSVILLMDLIKKNKTFDFIYVDGSHKCIDCYVDCLLSWELLNKNGVLAIDDYLYKCTEPDILDRPFCGVNHFLEKFNGQYTILEKGYRVFLLKLV